MAELGQQKLLRAVHSERQLQEVLVDFWFNHFNVFARKGPRIQPYLTSYERDAIRPHVLGKFRDLLGAVAESPAMLIYLDNWLSSDPDGPDPQTVMRQRQRGMSGGRRPPIGPTRFGTPARGQTPRRQSPQPQPRRRGGLNENYARELLELHTLGVDGATRNRTSSTWHGRSRAGRSIPPNWVAASGLSHDFTIPAKNRSLGRRSKREAARATASRCWTCWPGTLPRPSSSPWSWLVGSSLTIRHPRWSRAPRPRSETPTATSARWCEPSSPRRSSCRPRPTRRRSRRPWNSW